MKNFLDLTKNLPDKPGVYWFLDDDGKFIYVSRSRNIKDKVRDHLYKSKSVKNKMIQQNLSDIGFEVLTDRLLAAKRELELIKLHYPPLNGRNEGLKQYRFIELTMAEKFPRARKKKTFDTGKEIMIGPFPKTRHIQRILSVAANYYKIADCGKEIIYGDDHKIVKTCIRRRTDQCLKPCEDVVDKDQYGQALNRFIAFFKGETDDLVKFLKEEMSIAAKELQFEKANALKDDLEAIKRILAFY